MGDDETSQPQALHRRGHVLLHSDVKVRGALVHDQDAGTPIERARKQDTLLLTAGEGGVG